VASGNHVVEIHFVGTAKLWLAAIVSAIGWMTLIALSLSAGLNRFRLVFGLAVGRTFTGRKFNSMKKGHL
jgi:hypothetical protein